MHGDILTLQSSVLLEKWYDELPEPLRVSTATLLNQSELRILPHVLVMNIMFHFAVVLLNRPDYCDTSRPLRETLKKRSATISTTATEKCNQASYVVYVAEINYEIQDDTLTDWLNAG